MRSFRRSPAFTLVALLSLTLGIGATSAIFSVIYGVLISPYPYAKPGEIWAPGVRAVDGRGGHNYTPAEIPQMAGLPAFADVMSTSIETVLMTGDFPPESFGGVLLTGNSFNFLGVRPVIGRTIQPSDVRPDGNTEPVVVLSHKLWLRLFQGSTDALGKTLRLNDRPYTIVGVMPPRFGWYGNDGFWLPLSLARTDLPWTNPIARLAPGVSKQSAEEQLRAFNQRLAQEKPSTFPKQGFTTTLMNYLDVTVASGEMRTSLQLLLGGVAFLLLIACANVANLQLARGTARAREMAVRMSIGADRRRLLRQLLTESVLLSLAGGVLGVLFAFAATNIIVGLMPEFYVPNESRVTINIPVMLFSLVRVGDDRNHLRARASVAELEAGSDRRTQGRTQHGRRRARQPDARSAGDSRSGVVGRAPRERGADGADVPGAPAHRLRSQRRARAAGGGSSPREEVHDAGAAQPLHTAATRAGVLAARRPGSVGWRTVRRSADHVPNRGSARHRAAPSHNVSRRSGPPSDVRDRASRRTHVRRVRSAARRSRGPRQRDGCKAVAGG